MSRRVLACSHAGGYEGIEFRFAYMEQEIRNIKTMAKRFLDRKGMSYEFVIGQWLQDLINIRYERSPERCSWEIPENQPITTALSEGRYEPEGRSGGLRVLGTLSCKWEIEACGRGPHQTFRLTGLGSTKVTILRAGDTGGQSPLAQWQFEVGDPQSPGSHFHVGVPSDLPVPRLPSILVTPMDALDFLLGELFQTEWRRQVAQESDAVRMWAQHQRRRLTNLLRWQAEQLDHSQGSPWVFLKHSKPHRDVLLGRARR